MYEDIEELPECCKKIAKIEQMFQDNLAENDDKQKIKDRIWPILDTKLNSLKEQLEKIQAKDEKVKNAIDDFLKEEKNVTKYNLVTDKGKDKQSRYQRLLYKAEKVIKAMTNDSADNGLNEVNKGKEDKKDTVIKNV